MLKGDSTTIRLTGRQMQLVNLMGGCGHLPNREIARRYGTTEGTLKVKLQLLYDLLGMTRTEIIVWSKLGGPGRCPYPAEPPEGAD